MEACGGSNHIARTLAEAGFETRIISAQFVKPYVKGGKNDAKDAEAIAEAARRPNMRFVGTKSVEQQDIQSLHRAREGHVKRRTALGNEIRGFLMEYGITVPKGISQLKKRLPSLLEEADNGLTVQFRENLRMLYEDLSASFERVEEYGKRIGAIARDNDTCRRLCAVPGLGPIVSTAAYAATGDAKAFKNGREYAAWLGLTPRQNSTGGWTILGRITKRGDGYVRKNLVHGCRTVVCHAEGKSDGLSEWIKGKLPSKGTNKTAVAAANRTARVMWVIMARGEEYRPDARGGSGNEGNV